MHVLLLKITFTSSEGMMAFTEEMTSINIMLKSILGLKYKIMILLPPPEIDI